MSKRSEIGLAAIAGVVSLTVIASAAAERSTSRIILVAGGVRARLLHLLMERFAVGALLALLAVVAVPAASANPGVRVNLSLLPLPASSLGSAAIGLPLEGGSGIVVEEDKHPCGRRACPGHGRGYEIASEASPVVPNNPWMGATDLQKLGMLTGYGLEYGNAESGGTGVTQIWTRVDEYRTSADATKGLAFWRQWDPQVSGHFAAGGLSITAKKETVAAVGRGRFAVLVGYRAANIAPLFGFDEHFTAGRFVGDVTVWAGNTADVSRLAPRLAKKLDTRIKQALAGSLHAEPVKLPPAPQPAPPPGAPVLAALALKPTDLTGQATAVEGHYLDYPFARSTYFAQLSPAGQFSDVSQEMWWYPTANEASFESDFWATYFVQHPLYLSNLGDGARGSLLNTSQGPTHSAGILFCSGQLLEDVDIESESTIQPSQVESIGQTIANDINADGLGS